MKRERLSLSPAEADLVRELRERVGGRKELRSQALEPDTAYYDGIPQPLPFAEVSEAYGVHVWVYACVRAISTAMMSVDVLPYTQGKDGEWQLNERHPFHQLLMFPNPYMTGRMVKQFVAMTQALTGNAYYALERLGGKEIKELWPLPAGSVKPVTTKTNFIDHYVYEVGGSTVRFGPEEIIHFRDPNPTSLHYGQGAMAPVLNAITADLNAIMWNKTFFKNGAKLDGVLETDKTLDTDVRRRVELSWQKMFVGAEKAGKTAIIDGGLKYKPLTASVKDMDFVELRKQARDEVLAAFNVPPSVVGLLEFANYSNMKEQMRGFWTNNILPRLVDYSEVLTLRAKQITGDAKTVFQADTSTVEALRTNEKERADTVAVYVNAGIPINEIIRKLDLPFDEIDGGDVPRAPAAPVAPQAPQQPMEPMDPPAKGARAATKAAPAEDEAKKEMAWKSFDARLTGHEEKFTTTVRGFFKGQRRRVLKALDENAHLLLQEAGKALQGARRKKVEDTVRVIFNVEKEQGLMADAVGKRISGAYFDFAVAMAQSVKPAFNFNLDDPYAQAWVEAKKIKLVQQANAYTLDQLDDAVVEGVQQAVAAGFAEGEAIQQIADRIEEVYNFAVSTRAERIARTEVISAANAGALDGMRQTGVEQKAWLTSRDARVRETHAAIEDAGPVPLNDAFLSPSGAALQFPGDPSAPPEEIVNCRCALVAK